MDRTPLRWATEEAGHDATSPEAMHLMERTSAPGQSDELPPAQAKSEQVDGVLIEEVEGDVEEYQGMEFIVDSMASGGSAAAVSDVARGGWQMNSCTWILPLLRRLPGPWRWCEECERLASASGQRDVGSAPEEAPQEPPLTRAIPITSHPDEPNPDGTYPKLAVQLSRATAASELDLCFSWELMNPGISLEGFCLLVREDGRPQHLVHGGLSGSLNTLGVGVLPQCAGSSEGRFRLRLGHVPAQVFGAIFIVTAEAPEKLDPKRKAAGFAHVSSTCVALRSAGSKEGSPHIWRYRQPCAHAVANVWVCTGMYRGPNGRWRLEPLVRKFSMHALARGEDRSKGIHSAGESIAWQLKWWTRDRSWAMASEERQIVGGDTH